MIKFFRSIRVKLIGQNNVRKYLLYALGEILLVVIGILIALQVNNWNTQRLNNIEAENIRASVNEEFRQNRTLLELTRSRNQNAFDANMILLDLMGESRDEIQNYNLDSLFYYSLEAEFYFPTKNTVDGLFQTGRFDLIRNVEVQDAILNWNNNLELFKEYKDVQTNWQNNYLVPYMISHVALVQTEVYGIRNWGRKSKLDSDMYSIFQDIRFENIIDNNLWLLQEIIDRLDTLKDIQENIIKQTDSK